MIGYRHAHSRVVQARGPAASHACGDCGEQAEHWAWQHGPEFLVDDRTGCRYSLDVMDYEPLCRKCHGKLDGRTGCVVDACQRDHYGQGYCKFHHQRWYRTGDPLVVRPHYETQKTHCPQGHPYAGENLSIHKKGFRICVTCRREKARARYARRRQ